jgi:hypothetical protein
MRLLNDSDQENIAYVKAIFNFEVEQISIDNLI